MSTNKLINAVIALVEERPADAREMLRSPEMKTSVSEVQNRLATALRKREAKAKIKALKSVLTHSLRIDTDIYQSLPECREAFVLGISAVERIIDGHIEEFET